MHFHDRQPLLIVACAFLWPMNYVGQQCIRSFFRLDKSEQVI